MIDYYLTVAVRDIFRDWINGNISEQEKANRIKSLDKYYTAKSVNIACDKQREAIAFAFGDDSSIWLS